VKLAIASLRSNLSIRQCRNRLLGATALAALAAAPILPAMAQTLAPLAEQMRVSTDEQMLLEADQLLYDFDREVVTAIGNVQIYYGAAVLDAERVEYDQKSGRLVATGGVRLLEPNGNVLTAERMDITDDFRDAFIDSINVVTIDRARLSAQTGERRDGNLTIFRKGVYTACAPCLDDPGKPPLWQIKAARIIHDQAERTIYYENARLEFFGVPIAYVPVFYHPDPTVKKKTGFLTPTVLQSGSIGFGVTTPFFWNLAPNYDVTFSPTVLTRQGLLMQAEWRHRLMNGAYAIRASGIFQRDKDEFVDDGERLSGYRDFRGSVNTIGEFDISHQWTFGWDLHATTDRTFNRDYRIAGATSKDLTSTVYLTGLSDRNYFDLRGYYFNVQRENTEEELPDDGDPDTPDVYVHSDQAEQAVVHPVLDHNYVLDTPVLGGELRFDSNIASLSRDKSDIRHPLDFDEYYAGVAGTFTRATTRMSWRKRLIGPLGQMFTPFSYVQADANWVSADDTAAGLSEDEVLGRAMPAAGLEYEWPFLAVLGSTVHTFGPKAQIITRPDEAYAGELPNEDSQSLVFDDTTLFVWDKFSGYDRQEGGTRANLGLVYTGLFPNGASVDALVGQSFQLAGRNSFTMRDHALTGLGSGLESDASDYVGRVTLNTGTGLAFTARGRLDDADLDVNHAEINALGAYGDSVASIGYAYFRESPSAGIFDTRQEVSGSAALEFVDNWSALGGLIYDIENDSAVSRSVGLGYADECFAISAVYTETLDPYTDLSTDHQVFVRINLRTLGDSDLTTDLIDEN
jgi:LPS-assembly protein